MYDWITVGIALPFSLLQCTFLGLTFGRKTNRWCLMWVFITSLITKFICMVFIGMLMYIEGPVKNPVTGGLVNPRSRMRGAWIFAFLYAFYNLYLVLVIASWANEGDKTVEDEVTAKNRSGAEAYRENMI